ncbi:MAG: hypothetical protein D4S02_00025 [Rhodocyclaceae bacterium]|nr:MAG: hypothetical protein D4S02_00025 [Rhodocyclaceae bacterium]
MLHTNHIHMRPTASRFVASEMPEAIRPRVEILPFTVRIAQDEADIDKAVKIRHAAYARHVPALASKLTQPEQFDFEDGMFVLIAESKLDGSPLGSMRIQTNQYRPLLLEESVELPLQYVGKSLAEATRLGIIQDRAGRLAKIMMFKAMFMWCVEHEVDWMVIAARSPLDRQYEALMFDDVFPGVGFQPMRHAGNIPHRVFSHEIESGQKRWAEAEHPLYDLFFNTEHPDIDIGKRDLPAFPHQLGFNKKPQSTDVLRLS